MVNKSENCNASTSTIVYSLLYRSYRREGKVYAIATIEGKRERAKQVYSSLNRFREPMKGCAYGDGTRRRKEGKINLYELFMEWLPRDL